MVEEACTCDAGCGVAHTHLGRRAEVRLPHGGPIVLREHDVAPNPDLEVLRWVEDEVQPWVDWKSVARGFTSGTPNTREPS